MSLEDEILSLKGQVKDIGEDIEGFLNSLKVFKEDVEELKNAIDTLGYTFIDNKDCFVYFGYLINLLENAMGDKIEDIQKLRQEEQAQIDEWRKEKREELNNYLDMVL